MRSTIFTFIGSVAVATFALTGCAVASESGEKVSQGTSEALDSLPAIPPAIAVPAGNELDFVLDAIGVQIYACQASGTGFSWVFQAPKANLFENGEVAGTHFVGPTWQSKDGSSVVGKKLAAASVDPTSIPWLLLQAVSHAGAGAMSKVSYVQRLSTKGGLAPSAGCDAAHVGAAANVNYTATYAFYKAQ
jgi:hypothetical protein